MAHMRKAEGEHGRKPLLGLLWATARVIVLVYLGMMVLLCVIQRKLVFPAGGSLDATPAVAGWDYEEVWLELGEGERSNAWYIPAPDEAGVVLFSHGNAGNISHRLDSIRIFRDLGFSVFIYDYGGYGLSTGKPSEQRCYKDIRAAWAYLTKERGVEPGKIVLFGRSLGGGPTVELAATLTEDEKPGAVILESTFRSTASLGQELYPIFPVKWLLWHRFDNERKVPKIRSPLLVAHSPEDDIVPFRHGERLYALANEPKQFLRLRGCHNEGFLESGEDYIEGLRSFLSPLFPRGEG